MARSQPFAGFFSLETSGIVRSHTNKTGPGVKTLLIASAECG